MNMPATGVVMFHSVGVPDPRWPWSYLTVPWRLFDRQLAMLCRFGYRSVFLDEYVEVARAGRVEKERVVALTFDDGYLDNWVYAAPILEKHGCKATVFMTTDFIDPSRELRPRLDPAKPDASLPGSGFLSWPEMQRLEQGGLVRIESHACTHTWYPCGPEIVDFRHPGDSYHWMDWNASPGTKWAYMEAAQREETWGEPVYRHAKALEAWRYLPAPRMAQVLRDRVANEGRRFFNRPDWRAELIRYADGLPQEFRAGTMETEEEFFSRAVGELKDSQRVLSQGLGRPVRFFCWPGGGYVPRVFEAAAEFYDGTTVASRDRSVLAGFDGQGCFRFTRIAPPSVEGRCGVTYLGPSMLPLYLEEVRGGNRAARLIRGARMVLARRLAR